MILNNMEELNKNFSQRVIPIKVGIHTLLPIDSCFRRNDASVNISNDNKTDSSLTCLPCKQQVSARLTKVELGMKLLDYFSFFFTTQKNKNQFQNKTACLCKQGLMLLDCFFFDGFFIKGFLTLDENSI